jgi:Holliday junction DNA helicase RuvB
LQKILHRSALLLQLQIEQNALLEIAKRSRGTPRIANHLLRWVRDFGQTKKLKKIDLSAANAALSMLAIDELGLDEMDKKILTLMIEHHNGGPVGLNNLAGVGEEPHTLEEVHEPFLIMQGFIRRTPRGREVTPLALAHMKKELK